MDGLSFANQRKTSKCGCRKTGKAIDTTIKWTDWDLQYLIQMTTDKKNDSPAITEKPVNDELQMCVGWF